MKLIKIKPLIYVWVLLSIVFFILWSASFIGTLDGSTNQHNRFLEAAFFSLGLWLVLLAAVRKVWIFLITSFPAALVAPGEIWFRREFGNPISVQSLALALETSWTEIINFLLTYKDTLTVYLIIWCFLYIASIWYSFKYKITWKHSSRIWCLIIFPLIVLFFYFESGMPVWIQASNSSNALDGNVSEGWYKKWEDIFPLNILISLQQYDLEKKKIQKIQANLRKQSMGGRLIVPEKAPEIVVLIIGESATSTRWSLLGYTKKTTPNLDVTTNLIAFSDVVGLSVATRSAVPGVLSNRPVLRPDDFIDLNAESSLIKAFSEAGFHTHWFSNQSPFGKFDTPIAIYAREAEDVRFLNPSDFKFKGSFDEVLLNPLRSVLKTPGRHLIVLHMLGSHFEYSMRYPDEFNKFKSVAGAKIVEKNQKEEAVSNSYNNSILYTDYILSKVIEIVDSQKKPSLVAYFSDHGSDVPNEACPYLENTRAGAAAFRVPVFFWFSELMKNKHLTQWNKLSNNKNSPYTTRAMLSTLYDLADVSVSSGLPQESFLLKPDIIKFPRNVVVNSKFVNYNVAELKNSCIISAK